MTISPSEIRAPKRHQLQVLEVDSSKTPAKQGFINPDPEKFEVQTTMRNFVLICRETFLPAYKDKAEHDAESAKYFPEFTVENSWRCVHCGRWHFTGVFIKGSSGKHLASEPALIDPNFNYPAPPKGFKPHVYKERK